MRWRRLVPLVLLSAAACSDSAGPGGPDIGGRWAATLLTAGVATPGYSCAGGLSLDLTRSAAGVGGSYAFDATCTTPHERIADVASGSIQAGRLSDRALSFEAGACTFAGTVAAGADRITGTLQCASQAGLAVGFAGSWSATRM